MLHHKGGLKCKKAFKDALKKAPKKSVVKFEKPSEWSHEAVTSKFVRDQTKKFGFKISDKMSYAIARKVGPNFGSLFYEIQKACVLAEIDGDKNLEPKHFKAFGSVSNSAFIDFRKALEERKLKATFKAMKALRQLYPTDPTMQIASGMQKRLLQMVQIWDLQKRKVLDKKAAAIVGLNPFVYKNLLPSVRAWGKDLPFLVAHFAKSQRCVLSGTVNPWAEFEAGLIKLLSENR